MGDNNQKEMKIHYLWDNWKIQYRLDLRNKIKEATEDEKIILAKHMGLEYPFMLKRQVHKGFRNYIFYKVLQDKSLYRKVIQIITSLLSENIMYKDQINTALSSSVPRAKLKMPNISLEKISEINAWNKKNRIEYLKQKLENSFRDGDIDLSIVIEAEISELLNKNQSIEPYFSKAYTPSTPIFSKKYDFFMKSFEFSNLNYYRWYHWRSENIIRHLEELIDVFGNPIRMKILDLLVKTFEIEPEYSVGKHYFMLINNLLTIASLTYFNTLSLDEKVEILNLDYKIEDYVDLIIDTKTDLEINDYLKIAKELETNKYHKLALKLIKFVFSNYKEEIKDSDKTFLYSILGEIHRNLKNHNKALQSFINAYKWVDKSIVYNPTGNERWDKLQAEIKKSFSLRFRKGICLTYIVNCYGHLEKNEEKDKTIAAILSIIKTLKVKKEKFYLTLSLSAVYRWLHDYSSERKMLINAQNIPDIAWDDETLRYFDERGQMFEISSMKTDLLVEIEKDIEAKNFYEQGESAQRCFNFRESIDFFTRAIQAVEKSKNRHVKFLALKKMGFSNMYLKDWSKMREALENALEIKEDFGSDIFLVIALFQTGEEEKSIELVLKLASIFEDETERFHLFFENWTLDLFTSLGKDQFLKFVNLLEKQVQNKKWNLIYNFSIVLADHGMSELAIDLFKREINITQDKKTKANYYNNIGSVYSDLDHYDRAFEYFQKAIEENPDQYLCYRNIGQTYAHKGDFANAKKYLEKGIEVLKKLDKNHLTLDWFRDELDTINLLLKNTFLSARIEDNEVRDMLSSAERILIEYRFNKKLKDVSAIIIGYAKALETMLHKKVAIFFEPHVKEIKSKFHNKNVLPDFKYKFKNLFYNKSISLGTWVRIIQDLSKSKLDNDTIRFNEVLSKNLSQKALTAIKKASAFISQLRNPLSHTKSLTMDELIKNRVKIIELMNSVIDELY